MRFERKAPGTVEECGSAVEERKEERSALPRRVTVFIQPLLLGLLAWAAAGAAPGEERTAFVSVLIPLTYGERCWLTVSLENLRTQAVEVEVQGHDGSGALVGLEGAPTIPLVLEAGQKASLRLQVDGQESAEAWVKVTERGAGASLAPGVAVSGTSECTARDEITTVPGAVAFPSRNPWLEGDVEELQGKMVLVLNSDATAAAVRVCYSNGSQVEMPAERGRGGGTMPVCRLTRSIHLPPYGLELLPVERDGSTRLTVRTTGAALVLEVLKPRPGKTRVFTVDSSIVFEDLSKQ